MAAFDISKKRDPENLIIKTDWRTDEDENWNPDADHNGKGYYIYDEDGTPYYMYGDDEEPYDYMAVPVDDD